MRKRQLTINNQQPARRSLGVGGSTVTQSAFTLVELLVVIAIIGILSGIGVATFTAAQKKARDGRRKSDLEQMQTGLNLYAVDHGGVMADTYAGWETTDSPQDLNALIPDYLNSLPTDPGSGHYYFDPEYVRNAWRYRLYVVLENTSDPDIAESRAACSAISLPCGGGSTAYCVCGP